MDQNTDPHLYIADCQEICLSTLCPPGSFIFIYSLSSSSVKKQCNNYRNNKSDFD